MCIDQDEEKEEEFLTSLYLSLSLSSIQVSQESILESLSFLPPFSRPPGRSVSPLLLFALKPPQREKEVEKSSFSPIEIEVERRSGDEESERRGQEDR